VRVLGGFSYLHRRSIVAIALVATIGAAILGTSVFDRAQPFGFSDPASESSHAYDLIENSTGARAVPAVILLVTPGGSAQSGESRAVVRRAARTLAGVDGIVRVVTPAQDRSLISDSGAQALVEGFVSKSVDNLSKVGERTAAAFDGDGAVQVGGTAIASVQLNDTTESDLRKIELYASPIILLISLLVFRSLVAAVLPLIVGGLSIAFTLAALRLLSQVMTVDIFALNVVTVLGLGLAIDYSLFMVSRYREELARSGPGLKTMCNTVGPIGRMICFSAGTVAAAVASLCIFPQPFLYSTGVGCAVVTLISALVVIVVLPAILGLLGTRINALSISDPTPGKGSPVWRRIAAVVQARPGVVALLVTAVMLVAALPLMRIELTRADARVLPRDNSAREVDTAVRSNFRDDPADSIILVQTGRSTFRRFTIKKVPPVTRVDRPRRLPGGVTVVEVHTNVDPNSDRATDVVKAIRNSRLGASTLVGGPSAELVDQRASLKAHLPLAVTIVVASTLIAILLMTGSLVLAMITLFANLLTIGVALGVLVLVFQDNRFESLLVYTGVGALDISVPILLFAVIFGLSTDYGVFLLNRVTELRRTESDPRAISLGLERSGRIITAAAILFAVAMGSFVFSQMIFIKEVAVGTALAVLVDATLIRAFLMPALIHLCGERAWWSPRPLARLARTRP
jgi:RND superfamily putative drug exporter